MSSRHAIVSQTRRGWEIVDDASKNGTRVNGELLRLPRALRHGDIVECGRSFFLFRETHGESPLLDLPTAATLDIPPLHYQIAPLYPFIKSDIALHLYGETGTGKEVVARAIHELSGRAGPFVALNCASLPDDLSELEMLGLKRSDGDGAPERRGPVCGSQGGTLFLDEIGELSSTLQAKLVRVLEFKEVLPAGASRTSGASFRLLSATLCDLEAMVAAGRFRGDLYARLGHACTIEPLRDHREELGRITQSCLLAQLAQRTGVVRTPRVHFTLEAARALVHYAWPYNIRQLKHCIEAALIAATIELEGEAEWCRIALEHLPESLRSANLAELDPSAEAPGDAARFVSGRDEGVSDREIIEALRGADGNRGKAAKLLGVCERTLYRRLRKLRERRADSAAEGVLSDKASETD